MTTCTETEHFIQQAADFFDQLVPVATDDELFAAGYLRGHLDLVVGTLQVAGDPFAVPTVLTHVEQSLAKAISQGELSLADEQHVRRLWQRLQQANETF